MKNFLFLFIALITLLLSFVTISCKGQMKQETTSPILDDLDYFAKIDSMEYATDYLLKNNHLYVLGYSFENNYAIKSKLSCINIQSKELKWSKTFNDYQTTKFTKMSSYDNAIYITGSVGETGRLNENTTEEFWDLYPAAIKVDFNGNVLHTGKTNKVDSYGIVSRLIKCKGTYFMAYITMTVDNSSKSYEVDMIELSEKLETRKIKNIHNQFLNSLDLIEFGDHFYLMGKGHQDLPYLYKITEYLFVEKVNTDALIKNNIHKITEFICYKDSKKLNFVGMDKDINPRARNTVYMFSYDGSNFDIQSSYTFPDSIKWSRHLTTVTNNGFFSLTYDGTETELLKISKKSVDGLGKFTKERELKFALNPEDTKNAIYIFDKGNKIFLGASTN